jgi:hypothetical protein
VQSRDIQGGLSAYLLVKTADADALLDGMGLIEIPVVANCGKCSRAKRRATQPTMNCILVSSDVRNHSYVYAVSRGTAPGEVPNVEEYGKEWNAWGSSEVYVC